VVLRNTAASLWSRYPLVGTAAYTTGQQWYEFDYEYANVPDVSSQRFTVANFVSLAHDRPTKYKGIAFSNQTVISPSITVN